jgi:hypothetical protein
MVTAVQVQYRRDTAANVAGFTGAAGEIVVDTTRNRAVVQDGATAGGFPLAKVADAQGYGFIGNCSLTASVASNNLTVALKNSAGGDPSAANSVFVPFRNATLGTGTPSFVEITAALSIQIASGDTLGAVNGVPFRFWIVIFNSGGTPVLGAVNCAIGGSTPTGIFPLDETALQSPASTIGNSAGVLYSGASVSANSPMRILGYVEYGSGLTTAGTYNAAPSKVQLFGPGVTRPGQTVQSRFGAVTSVSITPVSAANLVKVFTFAALTGANNSASIILKRGTTTLASQGYIGSTVNDMGFAVNVVDNPQSTSSTTYSLTNTGLSFGSSYILLEELMS